MKGGSEEEPLPRSKIRFSPILELAGAMNRTARDIDDLSLWEFNCLVEGFTKANGSEEKPEAMSEEEHDDMVRRFG